MNVLPRLMGMSLVAVAVEMIASLPELFPQLHTAGSWTREVGSLFSWRLLNFSVSTRKLGQQGAIAQGIDFEDVGSARVEGDLHDPGLAFWAEARLQDSTVQRRAAGLDHAVGGRCRALSGGHTALEPHHVLIGLTDHLEGGGDRPLVLVAPGYVDLCGPRPRAQRKQQSDQEARRTRHRTWPTLPPSL